MSVCASIFRLKTSRYDGITQIGKFTIQIVHIIHQNCLFQANITCNSIQVNYNEKKTDANTIID